MTLIAGVTKWLPQWELILSQMGLPVGVINRGQTLTADQYAVIIVTSITDEKDKGALSHYLQEGGGILMEADVAQWLLGVTSLPAYVTVHCR